MKKQYRKGKVDFGSIIVEVMQKPGMQNATPDYIRACLKNSIPELFDPAVCPNCDASMEERIYHFDVLNALLLFGMAKLVREGVAKGYSFTDANKVRVQDIEASLSVKCRTTMASKLGLVAKVKGSNGRQIPGVWAITSRGWAALRGLPVPAKVKVWRNQIEEHFEENITIVEAFQVHREAVENAIRRNKEPKNDYRAEYAGYSPREWYDFNLHVGNLV